jgi:hemolysin activation/secretion protein
VRAEATLETASAGGLGGDFTFKRFIAQARGQRRLGATAAALRLLVGLTEGVPPLQKRLALGGRGTLRGYALKEFQGENMAVANLEWEARAPGFPRPGLVLFYDGGATWGGPATSRGWRSGAGLGFDWSLFGASLLRIDVGSRLGPRDGHDRLTVLARLRMPL